MAKKGTYWQLPDDFDFEKANAWLKHELEKTFKQPLIMSTNPEDQLTISFECDVDD